MANQYLRHCSLIVADDAGKGIELNQLAIKFVVHHGTYTFPHHADIRIYNLDRDTQNRLVTEFTKLRIMAGYDGNFGIIFQGAIKQVRIGRENGTDGFTDIFAADGDSMHNFGTVNMTLPAGYTQQQVWTTLGGLAAGFDVRQAPLVSPPLPNRSPRGKVMYGQMRDYLRDFANTNGQLVTVDGGMLTAMPLLAYKPGDAVVINEHSGMVGSPEQTEQGITVMCLLNPAIAWGTRLHLNNDDITQNLVGNTEFASRAGTGIPTKDGQLPQFAPLGTDGFYKALSVDHIGETRGTAWYTQIICISLDPTATIVPGTTGLNLLPPA